MSSLLTVESELSLWRKLIKDDMNDVSHGPIERLSSCYGMKIFLIKLLVQGCSSSKHNRVFIIHILRRIIVNIPATFYQHALTLVATGQCDTAMVYLKRAITKGHLPSRALMSFMLCQKNGNLKCDTAIELAKEGIRLGCHHCAGVMAYNCWSSVRPRTLFVEMARMSSLKGSRYGHLTIGIFYEMGIKGFEDNFTQAIPFYRQAAEKGLSEAQFRLGHCCPLIIGKDTTEALLWFQLAADQGHPGAMFKIGTFYHTGQFVDRDKTKAISWYIRAKKAGSIDAIYKLLDIGA